jgi:two-component system sensor kinase FixL
LDKKDKQTTKMKMKIKKPVSRNQVRNGERVRLEGVIKEQADRLKIKNGQLRNGAKKQKGAEKQIQLDATLIQKKEREILKQRDELLHVTRVGKLAEFVSSLAHEISQPLTAILSYTQAAQRILADREPKLQEILQHIVNDNHRAADVIQRMRLLLKKSNPEVKLLDINDIINETIMLITTDAGIRNVVIKTDLDINLPLIRGDQIQLQQVLLNLISNSFDALENIKGTREILIHTAFKNTNMIIVKVKDSGCGILAKNVPKLFTRFFTSKPDGLGMGLSISRSIIESHGGRFGVKNNTKRGATFYFTIPISTKGA